MVEIDEDAKLKSQMDVLWVLVLRDLHVAFPQSIVLGVDGNHFWILVTVEGATDGWISSPESHHPVMMMLEKVGEGAAFNFPQFLGKISRMLLTFHNKIFSKNLVGTMRLLLNLGIFQKAAAKRQNFSRNSASGRDFSNKWDFSRSPGNGQHEARVLGYPTIKRVLRNWVWVTVTLLLIIWLFFPTGRSKRSRRALLCLVMGPRVMRTTIIFKMRKQIGVLL